MIDNKVDMIERAINNSKNCLSEYVRFCVLISTKVESLLEINAPIPNKDSQTPVIVLCRLLSIYFPTEANPTGAMKSSEKVKNTYVKTSHSNATDPKFAIDIPTIKAKKAKPIMINPIINLSISGLPCF